VKRAEEVRRVTRKSVANRGRPSLSIVRRKNRGLIKRAGSRRIAPMVVLLSILVAGTVVLVLLEQVVLAQSAFKMAHMRQEMVAAEEEHAQLLLDAARLGSSERIENYALNIIGMERPGPDRVQYINADISSGWKRGLAFGKRGDRSEGANAAREVVLGAGGP
jgi:cell division protein FtsL